MKLYFYTILLFLFSFTTFSQDRESKWVAGLGVATVRFNKADKIVIGDLVLIHIPRINISRYLFKGITLDAGFSFGVIKKLEGVFTNSISYITFDGSIRYDFNLSDRNSVPYVFVGTSWIDARKFAPTLNAGVGSTLWVSKNIGLNVQGMYKFSAENIESMRSHFYYSLSVIYSLEPRSLTRRLWDAQH